MKKNNISKYLFGISAFIIVFLLASYTNESKMDSKLIHESDFSIDKEKLNELTNQAINEQENVEEDFVENEIEVSSEIDNNITNIKESILVNSIKIAKKVDTDPNSNSYREPINAYKTITTLDDKIVKDIDFYPSFYIWTSINTEKLELNTIDKSVSNEVMFIEPTSLSMVVTCNEIQISELEFNINAKTPRWREWIEVDLTQFESEFIVGKWNVKIINKKDNQILENRSFSFNKNWEIDELRQTAEVN
tara:strand:+ start:1500 stop:2246 length:747 start_codon:yes stop_codon:yes gene_type:complete